MTTPSHTAAPDLSQRPPRSPRCRAGGYVILPRLLDKARATLAGSAGAYKFNSTLDGLFFGFTGIDSSALLEQLKTGATDWKIVQWVRASESPKHTAIEIAAWSDFANRFNFHDAESREWFTGEIRRLNPDRDDIETIFDFLDLDDLVTFGGKA